MSPREFSPYVDRVPEFEVRDGVVCADFGDWTLHMPLRVFKIALARAGKAVRDYETSGNVVPFTGAN